MESTTRPQQSARSDRRLRNQPKDERTFEKPLGCHAEGFTADAMA